MCRALETVVTDGVADFCNGTGVHFEGFVHHCVPTGNIEKGPLTGSESGGGETCPALFNCPSPPRFDRREYRTTQVLDWNGDGLSDIITVDQGRNLVELLGQGRLSQRQVLNMYQSRFRALRAAIVESLTLGIDVQAGLKDENQFFECGWSWSLVKDAPEVDTDEPIGPQPKGDSIDARLRNAMLLLMEADRQKHFAIAVSLCGAHSEGRPSEWNDRVGTRSAAATWSTPEARVSATARSAGAR